MKTDNVMVPRELLSDLADLASDAAEQHRQAMGSYRVQRQAVIDRLASDARTLLAQPASEAVAVAHKHPAECYAKGTPVVHGQVHDGIVAGLMRALAHPPAPAVPDGWKLLPVEPTVEMIAALAFAGDADLAIGHGSICATVAQDYRAMLAADPTPGASDGKGGDSE